MFTEKKGMQLISEMSGRPEKHPVRDNPQDHRLPMPRSCPWSISALQTRNAIALGNHPKSHQDYSPMVGWGRAVTG